LSALSQVLAETGKEAPSEQTPHWLVKQWRYVALALVLIAGSGGWGYFHYAGEAKARGAAQSANLNEKYLQAMNLVRRADKQKNVSDATEILKGVLAQDPQFALAL